ncbi:MAG: flagellar export protein FliJ [Firmicutes bacterium]|nr:flagellar export protein FliJ [Bacillota bacterium]
MAKFVFRLQSYLGVKEQMENLKKNEYGVALRHLEEEKQRKRLLEQELQENVTELKNSVRRIIAPPEIRRYNNRIQVLQTWIVEQDLRIKAAEEFAEKKRLELVETMKEKKSLETVKEHSYEEYLKDEQRAEQAVVDGIVSYRYAVNE